MSDLVLSKDMRDIAREVGITTGYPPRASAGDSIITIHMGPGCQPEVARIRRSQWKTVTALNFSEGREFHMRLRRYGNTNYFIVYGSVTRSSKNQHLPTIFGDVIQRGRLCQGLDQVKAAIPILRHELGLPVASERLPP